jgi:hypothetical protein
MPRKTSNIQRPRTISCPSCTRIFADQRALAAHDKDVHQNSVHAQISLQRSRDGTYIHFSLARPENNKSSGIHFTKVLGRNVAIDHSDHPDHLVRTILYFVTPISITIWISAFLARHTWHTEWLTSTKKIRKERTCICNQQNVSWTWGAHCGGGRGYWTTFDLGTSIWANHQKQQMFLPLWIARFLWVWGFWPYLEGGRISPVA